MRVSGTPERVPIEVEGDHLPESKVDILHPMVPCAVYTGPVLPATIEEFLQETMTYLVRRERLHLKSEVS